MKILFMTHLYPPARGGAELLASRVAVELARRGNRVKVVTTEALSTGAFFIGDKRRVSPSFQNLDGVEVERLPFATFGSGVLNFLRRVACRVDFPGGDLLRTYSFGPRQPLYVKRAEEFAPDLVIATPLPTYNTAYAVRYCRTFRKPLILCPCYHIVDGEAFDNPLFYRWMGEASSVVALTPEEKAHLVGKGVGEEKIRIIPPIPLEEEPEALLGRAPSKEEARRNLGIPREAKVVFFLGQHGPHKKIKELFQACRILFSRDPRCHLLFAGGTSALTPGFHALADEIFDYGRERVHLFDDFQQSLKPSLFRAADLFAFLSEHESFGIALTEAMAYALPCVISRNGVGIYQVEEYRQGLWVEPRSPEEVARGMEEILADPALAERMGRASFEAAREFGPKRLLDLWCALVEEGNGR